MHLETPLLRSAALSAHIGADVWLKMETAQPTGSFKVRGIGALCAHLKSRGATHLVSSSGGNAGCAAAWCGRQLELQVTVVVPSTTPDWMQRRIEREGADVVVHGAVWDEAHQLALEMASAPEAGLVHPFDHPLIWDGHATLIEEAARGMKAPGAVVVAVGGGGLLAGVLLGMERSGWRDVPVLAVETEGAASFRAAMQVGVPVDIGAIGTIAKSLGARTVSLGALELAIEHGVRPWTVTDKAALSACRRFLDDHRVLVEPACGAALSAIYDRAAPLGAFDSVLVVVCGGQGVTMAQMRSWEESLG